MKDWKSPIRILLLYLMFLAIWASYNWGGLGVSFWLNQSIHFALLLLPGFFLYQVLLKFNKIRPTRWEHRFITALILFLLFDALFPWWVFLSVGLLTEALQRLFRLPTGPITNPAATGAVILSLIGQFPTWWGVNFGPRLSFIPGNMSVVMLLTTIVAGYVAWKYHKLLIASAATLSFSLVYLLLFRANPVSILVDGTFAFFLLVMAVEPKTSPTLPQQQRAYGLVAGLAVGLFLFAAFNGLWVEPYSYALVLTNLLFSLYKNRMFLMRKFNKTETTVSTPSPQAAN